MRKIINESPLLLLPSLAKIVGLKEAIVLQQIHYWLNYSKVEHKGKRWIYKSLEQWQSQDFHFWCIRTVQRIMKKLTKDGYIFVQKLDKNPFNHTYYYTINYDKINEVYSNSDFEVNEPQLPDQPQNELPDQPQNNCANISNTHNFIDYGCGQTTTTDDANLSYSDNASLSCSDDANLSPSLREYNQNTNLTNPPHLNNQKAPLTEAKTSVISDEALWHKRMVDGFPEAVVDESNQRSNMPKWEELISYLKITGCLPAFHNNDEIDPVLVENFINLVANHYADSNLPKNKLMTRMHSWLIKLPLEERIAKFKKLSQAEIIDAKLAKSEEGNIYRTVTLEEIKQSKANASKPIDKEKANLFIQQLQELVSQKSIK